LTGAKILMVDDNPGNMKLLSFILGKQGYEVRIAGDAEQALSILKEFRPRLILMDVQLPGMDGLELTRRLKADPAYADIVIIAVTASAMKGDEQEALAAGCDGYITKPIDTRLMPVLVARYLAVAPQQQ
jgi:CheY-like chemotaxis protein